MKERPVRKDWMRYVCLTVSVYLQDTTPTSLLWCRTMSKINIPEKPTTENAPRDLHASVKLDLIWMKIGICIRFYSLEEKGRAVCPWASLSSCVQMRGSVSGQADSSPIPTITVTRHQSVSKHFGPSAPWATVAPRRTPVLSAPALFPPSCQNPNPCVLLNLTTLCSTVYFQLWRWLFI